MAPNARVRVSHQVFRRRVKAVVGQQIGRTLQGRPVAWGVRQRRSGGSTFGPLSVDDGEGLAEGAPSPAARPHPMRGSDLLMVVCGESSEGVPDPPRPTGGGAQA